MCSLTLSPIKLNYSMPLVIRIKVADNMNIQNSSQRSQGECHLDIA